METGRVVFVNPLLSYEGEDVRSDNRAYPYPGLMILASVLDKSGYTENSLIRIYIPAVSFAKNC